MRSQLFALALSSMLVAASSAHASITAYTSLTSFNAAAGSTTVEDFSTASIGFGTGNYSGSFNGFSLTGASNRNNVGISTGSLADGGDNSAIPVAFAGQKFYGWGNFVGSPGALSTFTPSITASALGFDFFNTDFSDDYNVLVNGNVLATIGYRSSGFLGFVANGADSISSVSIRANNIGGYVSTAGIDNVRVASVPEPISLMLVGLGLFAVALSRSSKGQVLAA